MTITGSAGDDNLTGTTEADVFDLIAGGRDRANGLGGDDQFLLGGAFAAGDRISGGDGVDRADLEGDYAGLLITASMLSGVEGLRLAKGHDYGLSFANGVVAAGADFSVYASDLAFDDTWSVDFSRERDAGQITFWGGKGSAILRGGAESDNFQLFNGANQVWGGGGADGMRGGSGVDLLNGGSGSDTINGGVGADVLTGGAGADIFRITKENQSSAEAPDRITDLTNQDFIDFSHFDFNSVDEPVWTIVEAFTGEGYEIKVGFNAASNTTRVLADTDGDQHADILIRIDGDHRDFDNFLL